MVNAARYLDVVVKCHVKEAKLQSNLCFFSWKRGCETTEIEPGQNNICLFFFSGGTSLVLRQDA